MLEWCYVSGKHSKSLVQKNIEEKSKHLITDNQIKRPHVTKTFLYKPLSVQIFSCAGDRKEYFRGAASNLSYTVKKILNSLI